MSSIFTVEGVVEPWFRNGSNLQGANVPVLVRNLQFLASKFKLIYVLTSNSIEIKKRLQTPVLKECRKFLGTHQFTRLFRWFSIPSGSLVFVRPLLRTFFEKITSGLSTARLIPFWMNI